MIKKLFVGGLSQSITSEALEEHFSKYGDIINAVVMMEPHRKNRSRGFGFVTFSDHSAIEKALSEEHEVLTYSLPCHCHDPTHCYAHVDAISISLYVVCVNFPW